MKQNKTKRAVTVVCVAMLLVGIASLSMTANAVSKDEQLANLKQALLWGYEDVEYDINADGVVSIRDFVSLKKTIAESGGLTSDDYTVEDEDTFAGGDIK